jgi:triosephosphate isomerase
MATPKIVIGNWKMNGSQDLVREFKRVLECRCVERRGLGESVPSLYGVICVPFPLIHYAAQTFPKFISIGSQDCAPFSNPGAHTGDVSCTMLREAGATHVIIGHSERRQLYGESHELISQKFACAIESSLIPIVCVGESRLDYEQKRTHQVLAEQLASLNLKNQEFFIAYEPIWAIGTGLTPTLDEINDAHNFIFETCGICPIYGGSITTKNYEPILELDMVRGLLIGKESLDAEKFAEILMH